MQVKEVRFSNLKERAYRVGAGEEYLKYELARIKNKILTERLVELSKNENFVATDNMGLVKEVTKAKTDYFMFKMKFIEKIEKEENILREQNLLYNEDYPKPSIFFKAKMFVWKMQNKINFISNWTDWGKSLFHDVRSFSFGVALGILIFMLYFGYFGMVKVAHMINAYFVEEGFECTVNGTLVNNNDHKTMIYLGFLDSKNPLDTLTIDSARMVDGKFQFKVKSYHPAQAYISTDLQSVYLTNWDKTSVIYIEPRKTIECIIDLENPYYDIKVQNSSTYNDFLYVATRMKPFNERRNSIRLELNSAEETEDTAQIANLKNQLYQFDIELTNEYLKTLLSLDESSAISFDYYISALFNNEYLTDTQFKEIQERYRKIPWNVKECKSGQRLKEVIDFNKKYPHRRYGQIPDITAQNQEGDNINLRSLTGKYEVLLYVYKKDSPNRLKDFLRLKELYHSSPQGRIKIVTLCLNGDYSEWQREIVIYGDSNWTQLHATQTYNYNLPIMSIYNRWGDQWSGWVGCTEEYIKEVNKYLVWVDKLQVNKY